MARSDILVGVEIGTSKVCAVVAESGRDDTLHILGVGTAPSRGVRKGEVVDLAIAAECFSDALNEAETNSNVAIEDVSLAVTGRHIASFNSRGSITIPSERLEIDASDTEEVAIKAREVTLPAENSFLHSIIQHYYVDGQAGVLNPVGLVGRRLEADFHIIHGVKNRLQNILRCVENHDTRIEQIVVSSLATSYAVLNDHQRELGVLMIDIGGGVADYIVFSEGVVRLSGVLAVGGDHVNNDISLGLRIPLTRAEKLKIEEGSAVVGRSTPGEKIVLKNDVGFSGKEIERETLNTIIHARIQELFTLIHKQVATEISPHMLGAGVVLTGGCSQLRGMREVAESVFQMPVSLAQDTGTAGPTSILNNPAYSTAIGVVKFAQVRRAEEERPTFFGSLLERLGGIFARR